MILQLTSNSRGTEFCYYNAKKGEAISSGARLLTLDFPTMECVVESQIIRDWGQCSQAKLFALCKNFDPA